VDGGTGAGLLVGGVLGPGSRDGEVGVGGGRARIPHPERVNKQGGFHGEKGRRFRLHSAADSPNTTVTPC
jgi:hypothetical protein